MRGADAAPQNADLSTVLFGFTDASAVRALTAIDDRVMGDVSRSSLQHGPAGHVVFKGPVSLERNGGLAPALRRAGRQRPVCGLKRALGWSRARSAPGRK